jgi:uncharacterized damage-inducible protein DinB
MTVAEILLSEFEQEMKNTRRLLERVPEDKAGWKPHDKSRSLGELATHVAALPIWGERVIKHDEFDLAGNTPRPGRFTTTTALLDLFDQSVTAARAALTGAPDSLMAQPWTLKAGPKTVFSLPRATAIRSMMMNHHIHHRGQLTVYLRLLDVAIPGMYGPSADES